MTRNHYAITFFRIMRCWFSSSDVHAVVKKNLDWSVSRNSFLLSQCPAFATSSGDYVIIFYDIDRSLLHPLLQNVALVTHYHDNVCSNLKQSEILAQTMIRRWNSKLRVNSCDTNDRIYSAEKLCCSPIPIMFCKWYSFSAINFQRIQNSMYAYKFYCWS